jgi:hypothetical protein
VKRVGVCAIPNLCSTCHRFKPWDELITHFVPDTDYSSEDQSWRECMACAKVAKDWDKKGQVFAGVR